MKATLWIVPVLLAAGIGFWLVKTGREVRGLETDVEGARKQVGAAGSGGGAMTTDETPASGGAKGDVVMPGNRVNWRAISGLLKEAMDGSESPHLIQAFESLQVRLESMDKAELHAALDEIGGLGLSAEERSALEALVVETLMAKDPQGVLSRFNDRIGNDDDDVGWILSEALGHLAGKDPAAAVRWMDEQIKAGKFESKSLDGYSEARVEYESVLMSHLLGKQNMQAVERVRALPEGDRLVVLEQMDLTALGPEAQVAYADIVRSLVPEGDREGAFGYVASELVYEGGYEAVQAFLDRVNATPEERLEAAQEAASGKILEIVEEGKLAASDIDAMRSWVQKQSPDQVDRITGEAIGEAYDQEGNLGFEEAKKLLLEFHGKSGSDDLLIGFLNSFAGQENPEEAKKLLGLIKDPAKKQQLAEELE
jgi:uncharacterized protein (UPF0335 family)